MLWLNTMKVKLFCMDSLSSKKGPTSLEEEDSAVILLREGLHSFHSRCHRLRRELMDQMTAEDATDITVAFKPASLTPPCGCFFFQFPSIKLSPTLMSSPPREISGGQQVQSQGSPAAAIYLLTSRCWSNKPKPCRKLHCDIRRMIIWYPNQTVLTALWYIWLEQVEPVTLARMPASINNLDWHDAYYGNTMNKCRCKLRPEFRTHLTPQELDSAVPSVQMLLIKKKGQGLVTPLVIHSYTCKCVHTNTHTYANNKELHRHWVTLETLTNKHICAPRHTCSRMFSYKLSVTLTFINQKGTKTLHANKHVC